MDRTLRNWIQTDPQDNIKNLHIIQKQLSNNQTCLSYLILFDLLIIDLSLTKANTSTGFNQTIQLYPKQYKSNKHSQQIPMNMLNKYPAQRQQQQTTKELLSTNKQKQKQQFKLTSTKVLSYRTKCSSIQQLMQRSTQNSKTEYNIQQVRIMHSQVLSSVKGIEMFSRTVSTVNLSSNVISSIQGVQTLGCLKILQIRNNRIQSLKMIQKCYSLIKLDASNNLIDTFDGLRQIDHKGNCLEKICLAGNFFGDLGDLRWLSKLGRIKEIVFLKGKSSNPFCEEYANYICAIAEHLQNQNAIVDDQRLVDHLKCFQSSSAQGDNSRHNHFVDQRSPNSMKQNRHRTNEPFQKCSLANTFQRTPLNQNPHMRSAPQNQLLLSQQQLFQTQEMLSFKNQQVQDLRQKNSQLQLLRMTQYKQLIRKQTELQRQQGQNRQLNKQMQKKQKSLSQLHKRLQEMLRSSAQTSKVMQSKNRQIDKLKQQINESRITVAQLKALNKDYEKRLHDMHEKTLTHIQERTLKQDELKRKYQDTYGQNYRLVKQKEQMKDRVRELSQLLRQWEFKYENKVNQLQARHSHDREQLLKQAEERLSATTQHYEHQLHKMDDQMRSKVEQIENTYKGSLEEAYERQKKLKSAYEQRTKSQHQMRVFLKSALDKNQEQQSLIQQFQEIMIRLKTELSSVYEQKQQKSRQLSQIKYRHSIQISQLQQQFSKVSYQKSRQQKQLMNLKQEHSHLLSENESEGQHKKLFEEMQQRVQDLQAALDVKTQLLEDKNQTIETIKQEVDMVQRQLADRVDPKEFQSIRKKYDKYKRQCQQLSEETTALLQENQDLRKENQDCKEIAMEFEKMKDTLTSYEKAVEQKDTQLQQLVKFVEQCKRVTQMQRQQMQQIKRQYKRLETQNQRRERDLKDEIRQVQARHRRQLESKKIQNQKYRKNALQQLQSVFMKLQN